MTSDTSEIPIYAYIITIALLCIVYALAVSYTHLTLPTIA